GPSTPRSTSTTTSPSPSGTSPGTGGASGIPVTLGLPMSKLGRLDGRRSEEQDAEDLLVRNRVRAVRVAWQRPGLGAMGFPARPRVGLPRPDRCVAAELAAGADHDLHAQLGEGTGRIRGRPGLEAAPRLRGPQGP